MGKIHTHYDNLKVARDAPIEVIRAAYRSLSQKYHPDKCPGDAEAERIMKILNEAYAVLSDPERRRIHDEAIEAAERPHVAERKESTRSSSVSTKPKAKDGPWQDWCLFVRVAIRSPIMWIFAIGAVVASVGSAHDYFFPPQPREPYGRQVAADPAPVPTPPKPVAPAEPIQMVNGVPDPSRYTPMTDAEAEKYEALSDADRRRLAPLTGAAFHAALAKAKPAQQHAYVRPALDPYGDAWPVLAGYLSNAPIGNESGNSMLTIHNGSGDVFAKLYAGDHPVRAFYIPAGQTFTLKDITPGLYDVRYEYLGDGSKQKTDPLDITERETGDGIEFSNVTITLYAVQGGTMQTHPISDEEF